MFDTTRMHLKGQLVAARNLGWDGDVYISMPFKEAERLQQLLERLDALVLDSSDRRISNGVVLAEGISREA